MTSFAVMLAFARVGAVTKLAAWAGRAGFEVADASSKLAAAGFDGVGAGSSSGLTNVATVLEVADATWKPSGLAAGFAGAGADATVSGLAGRDGAAAATLSAGFSAGFAATRSADFAGSAGFAGAAATAVGLLAVLGLVAAALAGAAAVSACSSSSAPPPPNSLARKLGLRLTLLAPPPCV